MAAKQAPNSADARFAENAREGFVIGWNGAERMGMIQDTADPTRKLSFSGNALSGKRAFTVVVGQPCKYFTRQGHVVLVRLGRVRKPAPTQHVVVPQGVEGLARKAVQTFRGELEILDDTGLDGLAVVRRTETGGIMQVSKNIIEKPSSRPVLDEEPKSEAE